jgi:hypothetical protein
MISQGFLALDYSRFVGVIMTSVFFNFRRYELHSNKIQELAVAITEKGEDL